MTRLEFLDFKTNDNGYVLCNNFIRISRSEKFFSEFSNTVVGAYFSSSAFTCPHCRFMKYHECYFNKKEILEIIDRTDSPDLFNPFSKAHEYKCSICGHFISQILTVLKKKYMKRREGVEIPLICSKCYKYLLNHGNIKRKIIRAFLFYFSTSFLPISVSLMVIILPFFFPTSSEINIFDFLIIIIFLGLVNGFLIYFIYKRIRTLVRGNKLSKTFLSNAELRDFILK